LRHPELIVFGVTRTYDDAQALLDEKISAEPAEVRHPEATNVHAHMLRPVARYLCNGGGSVRAPVSRRDTVNGAIANRTAMLATAKAVV
jgi:hypothetical protein